MYFLCIDKPVGYTSHDVISLFRVLTGIKRIGHTGTLDPFATGVLLLAFQDATKLIGHIPVESKHYQCILQLGIQTETADCVGAVVVEEEVSPTVVQDLERVLPQFQGKISQKPPIYSAIKVNGKKLYEYARKGQTVEIPSRTVNIHQLSMMDALDGVQPTKTQVALDIQCSKGTYIRSLGCDLANAVGTVGHLSTLRRLSSDGLTIEQSLSFSDLATVAVVEPVDDCLLALSKEGRSLFTRRERPEVIDRLRPYRISVETVFKDVARVDLTEPESFRLAQGNCLPSVRSRLPDAPLIQALWNGEMLALLRSNGSIVRVNPSIADKRIAAQPSKE